jgi:hypothetical protein
MKLLELLQGSGKSDYSEESGSEEAFEELADILKIPEGKRDDAYEALCAFIGAVLDEEQAPSPAIHVGIMKGK